MSVFLSLSFTFGRLRLLEDFRLLRAMVHTLLGHSWLCNHDYHISRTRKAFAFFLAGSSKERTQGNEAVVPQMISQRIKFCKRYAWYIILPKHSCVASSWIWSWIFCQKLRFIQKWVASFTVKMCHIWRHCDQYLVESANCLLVFR